MKWTSIAFVSFAACIHASIFSPVEFEQPDKNTVWFVGEKMSDTPITFVGNQDRLREAEYHITLSKKDWLFDDQIVSNDFDQFSMKGATYPKGHLKKVKKQEKSNFAGLRGALSLKSADFEKKVIDGDDYILKLKSGPAKKFWKRTLTRSQKFKIVRVGAQPGVKPQHEYIAEMLLPVFNQKISLKEDGVTARAHITLDFRAKDRVRLVLIKADHKLKRISTTDWLTGNSTFVQDFTVSFPKKKNKLKEGRYFVQFEREYRKFLKRKTQVVYRSDPFWLVKEEKPRSRFGFLPNFWSNK